MVPHSILISSLKPVAVSVAAPAPDRHCILRRNLAGGIGAILAIGQLPY